jgi:hypothetical protein
MVKEKDEQSGVKSRFYRDKLSEAVLSLEKIGLFIDLQNH